MIITCPACSVRFQYDESRFADVPSKRFKCTKCAAAFEVSNPFPISQEVTPPPMVPRHVIPENQRVDVVSLVFLTGPKSSMAIELINPVTIIGRDEGEVTTMDPETSKRHAMIEIMSDGSVWIEDLGSTNGTFTEGQAVTNRVQLKNRQEFTCGNSAFMILTNAQ